MKKALKKKLSLNKETISDLNKDEMKQVKGGIVTKQVCLNRTLYTCTTATRDC